MALRNRLRSPRPRSSVRLGLRIIAMAAIAAAALLTARPGAQLARTAAPENFDIRQSKDAVAADYIRKYAVAPAGLAAFSVSRSAGVARLQAAVPGVDVEESPEIPTTTEIVSARPGAGFLTAATADRVGALRDFMSTFADVYGLSPAGIANLALVADYTNPAGNMSWVEFEQRLNGIPVFRGLVRGAFTANGELARTTGPLAAGLDSATLTILPTVSAGQAVATAANNVGWTVSAAELKQTGYADGKVTFERGPMADPAKAWLVYFPLGPGVARLAWSTEIWGDPDAFLMLVDAEDGTVLFRKNMTNYQTQSASFSVYNDDSPAPMSPGLSQPNGTQASFIPRTLFTLIGNEAPTTFNNLGWITDGANVTDGNNVEAGLDRDGVDGVDAPVTGSARTFNFTYDPATQEPLSTLAYQNGEVTDEFYYVNRYHDALYLLGFTELARNFQNDNFGRGGVAADRIRSEAEDSSGTNNANFSTPADGGRGRMQMYIFPGPAPDRTGGIDHDVLLHELTHGTSNRLHNNGSGLTTTMAGSMGEGWSDFYARALLSSAAEDPNGIYTTGGWVTYQLSGLVDNYYYGIRRFPYAVMSNHGPNGKPHNPQTFADIDPTQIDNSDGAYARSPIIGNTAFEVHNAGEVWCMALLEVRARFITRLGWATGNQRILQFVTDGMKLDPVNPTFLQARDSIIAAANAGGGTAADIADIWAGFATRGMGYSAQILNATTGSVVEAFDVPGLNVSTSTLVAESIPNGRLDTGEQVTVSLCISNAAAVASGDVIGTLPATGGVMSPSTFRDYGSIASGGSVCRQYTFTVGTACGGTLTASLHVVENGGVTKDLPYSFQIGSTSPFLNQNFDGVTAPALPAGWSTATLTGTANLWVTNASSPDTPANRAFAGDPATVSDNVLVSPSIAIPAGSAALTFRNNYATESTFDGGVLEIKIGAGAFQDIIGAGGTFAAGGYNAVISTSFGSPIGGRQAWSGSSAGYITTTVNLPPAASGQNILLRWRMASDSSVSATGWSVDTVSVASFVCSSVPTTTINLSPAALYFGATKAGAGGALTSVTPAQDVTLSFSSGSFAWTATSDQTWAQVTNGSGTGTGKFTVSIVNPANVIAGNIDLTATISISAPSAPIADASAKLLNVHLTVNQAPATSVAAFGRVDTPAQNAAGLQGALGLTGWTLDDVGVTDVKVYRTCFVWENQAACQMVLGNNVVFIGTAGFVPGARPDVEAAFPTYPQAYRAGWGLQLLSNQLPHVPNHTVNGGQGTMALYAVATDADGHQTLLGRSSPDHTPTTITLANDSIAKPFGTLDTPAQGATVSGNLANFGWALTPDTDIVSGNGDILIGTSGSTMVVFIDGVSKGTVAYNQCRGNVGNPVPAGVYCNDDVANIFGNASPQPPLTPRSSNPTKYRNLDQQRGAIGAFNINTNTLTNGVHTIAWSVTDSSSRADGIGSRFFTVLNGGPLADPAAAEGFLRAAATSRGEASSLDRLAPSAGSVVYRTGFDLSTAYESLAADKSGVHAVRLGEMGRLEMLLGQTDAGYLVANGELRDLPIGSHLDVGTGTFTWNPPAGYYGTYRLVFVRGGEKTVVDVTVAPKVGGGPAPRETGRKGGR